MLILQRCFEARREQRKCTSHRELWGNVQEPKYSVETWAAEVNRDSRGSDTDTSFWLRGKHFAQTHTDRKKAKLLLLCKALL